MNEQHRAAIERLIFGPVEDPRYTQDSPVLPDVWLRFAAQETHPEPGAVEIDRTPVSLLLTPARGALPIDLRDALARRLEAEDEAGYGRNEQTRLSFNDAYVVASLTFEQLVRTALPLTRWWHGLEWPRLDPSGDVRLSDQLVAALADDAPMSARSHLRWLAVLAGRIAGPRLVEAREPVEAFATLIDRRPRGRRGETPLWSINVDRDVSLAVRDSVPAVKADAARRLFDLRCDGLRWGIIDSGVDATHPAFLRRTADGKPRDPFRRHRGRRGSRVLETYDFTAMRDLVDAASTADPSAEGGEGGTRLAIGNRRLSKELVTGLQGGRVINWDRFKHALAIPHSAADYCPPGHEHGTHVAGILAGEQWDEDGAPQADGMCPDLELFDLRVLDESGRGSEFAVLAALQFVRWLNMHQSRPVIHGVNISLSLIHDVANFACGRTPICDECDRLVNAGVVVVVAAGNRGHTRFSARPGQDEGWYRPISITDPGNADAVITVGATHRSKPHTYGVSYFSSRGPTGDGRSKPDLVAPGEKITSAVPGQQTRTKDGTSMAAPHVSGAAAMLLARHRELIGDPARIKSVLCSTATDLARERAFQGAGMVDVLRALQSL